MEQRWEYHFEDVTLTERWTSKGAAAERDLFEAKFRKLGAQGWELVSYDAIPLVGSFDSSNIKSYAYLAIFKRPSALPVADPRPGAAGWHPDPYGRHELRYHDGESWKPQVSNAGQQSEDTPPDPTL